MDVCYEIQSTSTTQHNLYLQATYILYACLKKSVLSQPDILVYTLYFLVILFQLNITINFKMLCSHISNLHPEMCCCFILQHLFGLSTYYLICECGIQLKEYFL